MEKVRMMIQTRERINVKILDAGALILAMQLKAKEI